MVDTFNNKMKHADANTYMVNVLNNTHYPLNMTMTSAPIIDHESGLITLHFDGLFYDNQEGTTHVNK
jgi:hypothetical protein